MQTLTREEVKQMLADDEPVHLINVLKASLFAQARIPGSINIPVEGKSFIRDVERAVSDKTAKIIVYCASFECTASPSAAKKLDAACRLAAQFHDDNHNLWRRDESSAW